MKWTAQILASAFSCIRRRLQFYYTIILRIYVFIKLYEKYSGQIKLALHTGGVSEVI